MTEHTIRAFDADLQALARMISEMGGLAEKQVIDAIRSLDRLDVAMARRIIADDAKINGIQHEIEEKVISRCEKFVQIIDQREGAFPSVSQRALIANNPIIEARLPAEIGKPGRPDPLGRHRFELADDRPQ